MTLGQTRPQRKLFLADVAGFCQGVEHALALFQQARQQFGTPIYLLHELVHNRQVTHDMSRQGAVFVHSLDDVPPQAVLLLGAHGVSKAIEIQAQQMPLRALVNATCPFVSRLHRLAAQLAPEDDLILFGQPGHPEAIGILGHATTTHCHIITSPDDARRLPKTLRRPLLLVQTTMSHEETHQVIAILTSMFPDLRCPTDVCNASRQRQDALEQLCAQADAILVVGSAHSANANRLVNVARARGKRSWLIDSENDLPAALADESSLGLIGGASVPPELLHHVQERLVQLGFQL